MDENGNGFLPHVPKRRGRPPKNAQIPADLRRFAGIPKLIKDENRAAGFARARDIMFDDYEILSSTIQPYAVLKLAIELDRHALFSQLSESKTETGNDHQAHEEFQRYLRGETDVPGEVSGARPPASARVRSEGLDVSVSTFDEEEGLEGLDGREK